MITRRAFVRFALMVALLTAGLLPPTGRVFAIAPELNKSFSPTIINPGETSTITVRLFNPNPAPDGTLTNVAFSDNLPAGMFIAAPLTFTNSCGGSVTAVAGGTSFSLSGGTIPPQAGPTPGQCVVTILITTTVQGNLINTIDAGALSGTLPSGTVETNSTPASATLTVRSLSQLSLVKLMVPNTFYSGATSRLTLRVTNNDPAVTLTNVALTDAFPPELTVDTTPNITTSNCGTPTVTAPPGASSVAISGATIAPGQQCNVTLTVTQTDIGSFTNTVPAGSVTNNQGVTNQDAFINYSVQANVLNINKSFSPNPVNTGQPSTLAITVQNPNPVVPATGVSITDNLPTNVFVATPGNVSVSPAACSGLSLGANPGDTTLLITGSVPANTTCTVRVDVTSTISNVYVNTIPPGDVSSGNGFSASGSASASITFSGLNLAKAFTPSAIQAGGASRLRITFNNPGTTDMTGLTLTDTMPANLTIASPANAATTCPAGTVSTTANSVTGNGLTIPATGSCTVEVDVTSNTVNVNGYTNDIPANSATIGGTPVQHPATSARLQVVPPGGGGTGAPIGSKTFGTGTVQIGQSSQIRITVQAPTEALTNIAFTDTLPAGLLVASSPGITNSCGGTVTAVAGTNVIILSGGAISGATYPRTCQVRVYVVGSAPGSYTNLMGPGSVTATAGGVTVQNAGAFQATLNVNSSISGSKSFSPSAINAGETSTLTLQINAPAGSGLFNVGYTDNLPAGMIVATPNNLTVTGCGGGTVTAASGATAVTLSGATIAAGGNCRVQVSVAAPSTSGNLVNSLTPGTVTGEFAGGVPGQNTSAISATLSVTGLTVSKQFNPATISASGRSTLIITIRNHSSLPLTNLSMTDNLPTGGTRRLQIADPSQASTTCGTGLVNAVPGATTISMTGGQIQAQVGGVEGICTVVVDVVPQNHTGPYTSGAATNTINAGQVTSAEGINNRAAASANLNFLPLTLNVNKSFNPLSVTGGQSSVLTIEIENPQAVPIENAQFVDNLPAGMQVYLPPNLILSGCGSTWTQTGVTPGSTSFSFGELDIAANGSCVIAMQVTSTNSGNLTNTIPAGGVTSQSGASNPQAASASLTYTPGLGVAKAFTPDTITAGGNATVTIQIINTNGFALTNVNLTDDLPTGVTVTSPVTTSTDCGSGTVDATAGGTSVSLVNGNVAANTACQLTVLVTAATDGTFVNDIAPNDVTGRDPSNNLVTNSTGAQATLTVSPQVDVSITKTGPALVAAGEAVTYTLVVSNAGPSAADGTTFSDDVPVEIGSVAATCGSETGGAVCGAVNVAGQAVTSTITTLPAGGSVTFSITGTAVAPGSITNTATITPPAPDTDPANDQASWPTTIGVGYSLGNRVWYDTDNDGLLGGGEIGVTGVAVRLLDASGNEVATTTTDGSGYYRFDNLPAGDYRVEIAAGNFQGSGPLVGFGSSTGAGQEANPNADSDNNDNGQDTPVAGAIRGGIVTLGPGDGEPAGEGDLGPGDAAQQDNRTNLTVDFGFIPIVTYNLGNRVWIDTDDSGLLDGGESGVSGVTVRLLDSGGVVATTTTDGSGYYRFDNLPAGNYTVEVAAANFQSGGPLAGYASSTGAGQQANPNTDIDSDDNGIDSAAPASTGIRSGTVTLGPGDSEPIAEADLGPGDAALTDERTNLTVDFGFIQVPTYSLGNRVWLDADNSGLLDGGEAGIDGVTVRLLDGAGVALGTATTAGGGYYRFDDLLAGNYVVEVVASNFALGGPLDGLASSTGAGQEADANTDIDSDDNGIDSPAPAVAGVRSGTVTLGPGDVEPDTETDLGPGDPGAVNLRSNLTVDFGFNAAPTYSLGNRVWLDADNNGLLDGGETGIDGVEVRLLSGAGVALGTTTTAGGGFYRFDNLLAGDYLVEITAPNFGAGGPLAGYSSSTGAGQEADANADIDSNDNGIDAPAGSPIRSGIVTLGPADSEPLAEADLGPGGQGVTDARANLTVDFGFYFSGVVAPVTAGTPAPAGSVSLADPTITKLGDPALALPGETVTFTIYINNQGSQAATNVVVTDPVPAPFIVRAATASQGTYSIDASANAVTFLVGTVQPGQSIVVTITTYVDPTVRPPVEVSNTAHLTFDQGAERSAVAFITVNAGQLPATGYPPLTPWSMGGLVLMGLGASAGVLLLRRSRRSGRPGAT